MPRSVSVNPHNCTTKSSGSTAMSEIFPYFRVNNVTEFETDVPRSVSVEDLIIPTMNCTTKSSDSGSTAMPMPEIFPKYVVRTM